MGLPSLPSIPSPEAAAIKLAVEVLKVYLGREDLKDTVRLEAKNAGLQLALEAERYKVAAGRDPRSQRFGLRGGPSAKRVQAEDARSDD